MFKKTFAIVAVVMAVSLSTAVMFDKPKPEIQLNTRRLLPVVPELGYSVFRTGPLEVAKVFGRSQGCQDASLDFIQDVSTAAIHADLDPKLVAAEVAVESGCNPLAISSKGAVGLMQVHVKTWQGKYNFATVNLFERRQNLAVGTKVLGDYVRQWGLKEGVHRYNGMGVGCDTCDSQYSSKVLTLVGGKQQ